MGLAGGGVAGLILGSLAGQGILVGISGWVTRGEVAQGIRNVTVRNLVQPIREYSDFPKYNLPQVFLDGLRESGFVFLLSFFFGANVLGFYGLAIRVLRTPLLFIGSALAQVFYQKAAEMHNSQQNLMPLFKQIVVNLVILSVLASLLLWRFGPQLFGIVFGDRWIVAGQYSQVLCFWYMVNLISSPVSQLPVVFRRQKTFFYFGLVYNLLVLFVLVISANLSVNIEQTLTIVSLVAGLYLIGVIVWVAMLVRRENPRHAI
jgi:O-antigen/teichoic acid export membrane protein